MIRERWAEESFDIWSQFGEMKWERDRNMHAEQQHRVQLTEIISSLHLKTVDLMMMSRKINFLFFISSNNSTMSGAVVVRDHVADVQHVRAVCAYLQLLTPFNLCFRYVQLLLRQSPLLCNSFGWRARRYKDVGEFIHVSFFLLIPPSFHMSHLTPVFICLALQL